MTNKITKENLTEWITSLKEAAKEDSFFSVSWFGPTEEKPFSVVGGWCKMFTDDQSDLFCVSKSQPEYVMCVKIAVNDRPYAYTDFELLEMPTDKHGDVDDTCICLEWDDDPEYAAQFFLMEWERIMREHGEVL